MKKNRIKVNRLKKNSLTKGFLSAIILLILFLASAFLFHRMLSDLDTVDIRKELYLLMSLIIISFVFLALNIVSVAKYNKELNQQKRFVEERDARYRTIFELTSEGLYDMDADYNMKYYSSDWYSKVGLDVQSSELEAWTKLILEEDKQAFDNRLDDHIESGVRDLISEYRIKDPDGNIHWIEALGRVVTDENGQLLSMNGVHRDITRNKEHEAEILKMAYTDMLTKMPNRLKFRERFKQAISKDSTMFIFYLDIDNFKYINDSYGHSVGDAIILELGKRLRGMVAEDDEVFHLGSDEFAIISWLFNNKYEPETYVDLLLKELYKSYSVGKVIIDLTCSVGIVKCPDFGKSFSQMLINADIALYQAKEKRNTYKVFNENMGKRAMEKVLIESHLHKSIDYNELMVYYQPIINIEDHSLKGFEALARWKNSHFGMVFPDVFIPIAEHSGFITRLGIFVLESSVRFAMKLYEEYKVYYAVNVNVSTIQLQSDHLVKEVERVLVEYQLPATYLNLEITESMELDSNSMIFPRLAAIRKMGVKISLDDFGTGYSSFNNLTGLSVTHLKIDRSLTRQATSLKVVNRLIKGVVEFAHAMDMKVVAEGVENQIMEDTVRSLGIDYSQGYYYAKPIPEDNVGDFIEAMHKKD